MLIMNDSNRTYQAETSKILNQHQEAHEAWHIQSRIDVPRKPVRRLRISDLGNMR